MKKIILIAGSRKTGDSLHKQLDEYIGNIASIKSYAIDDGLDDNLDGDIFVFSSLIAKDEIGFNRDNVPVVIGKRCINYINIDKLFFVPQGSEVLFVNDLKETTEKCIESLLMLKINHLNYIPYYPGIKNYRHCEIAITPGEIEMVPREVKTIIDIGPRYFDIATLVEIMNKLGYYDESVSDIAVKYMAKIIELGKKLSIKSNEVLTLDKDLERLLIDLKTFENKSKPEELVSVYLNDETSKYQVFRNSLLKKRYYAKYTFEDIIGTSTAVNNAKKAAKKLAGTDFPVLIDGESGTGKELFASAIHNCSKRKFEPFLAINFSAITESLAESELFGYEDGSFTGAKRGGKIGYFEQADGGTIFLDEIGDASLVIQAELLRVLQEKEIMRVGGDKLIHLDIRIIACTNKDLPKLIKEGKFREDLYYRLKVGYIHLPSLNERKEDIVPIAEKYIKDKTNLTISSNVLSVLQKFKWKGNVRELINTMEYASAMCEDDEITLKDLPYNFCKVKFKNEEKKDDTIPILKEIYNAENKKKVIGRKTLCSCLTAYGYSYTEQEIRNKLEQIKNIGLITQGRGKQGTKLTEKGIEYLKGEDLIG